MIEIRRQDTDTRCEVCGRTVLLGERLVSYRRIGADDAQVCELCVDQADARGWTREGAPTLPVHLGERRERGLRGLLKPRKRQFTAPEPFDPELLPEDPSDAVEAGVELFNESTHPRTVSGIARTLGEPRVSVIQRSHREVVVTVAWELSWYQYRIDMLGAQTVTLQHRGADLDELDNRFCSSNALRAAVPGRPDARRVPLVSGGRGTAERAARVRAHAAAAPGPALGRRAGALLGAAAGAQGPIDLAR